jgi:methylenetetrahydrofolate reductase (NADPH)
MSPTSRTDRAAGETSRDALVRALREASYEVIPFASTEDAVLAHVPADVRLTVTVTAAKGLDRTLDLVERLRGHGYDAAPHLAARLFRDDAHIADVVARLRSIGVDGVFVVAGDVPHPVGTIPDAAAVLKQFEALGRPFGSVGVGGYPEGHTGLPGVDLDDALVRKAPHADHVVTQLCFDVRTTVRWARRVAARGVSLPVRVGVPGPVSRQKLVRVSAGLGLGQSARFLRKQHGALARFFLPGGYHPDRLVERLAPAFAGTDQHLGGIHVFTFNELAATHAWRTAWLERLDALPGQGKRTTEVSR